MHKRTVTITNDTKLELTTDVIVFLETALEGLVLMARYDDAAEVREILSKLKKLTVGELCVPIKDKGTWSVTPDTPEETPQ